MSLWRGLYCETPRQRSCRPALVYQYVEEIVATNVCFISQLLIDRALAIIGGSNHISMFNLTHNLTHNNNRSSITGTTREATCNAIILIG
jgi:hypothetical protein